MTCRSVSGIAAALTLTTAPLTVGAGAETNSSPGHVLLTDSFGKPVASPTNELHGSLHPPASLGWGQQIPSAPKGVPLSDAVRARIAASKSGQEGVQWFP